jgi:hypothetical protein
MAKGQKSPQEKKTLELEKDHFTFGRRSSRAFPKTWKRKKALVNRQYRRKSDELLVPAKPGINADDAELVAGEITAGHVDRSVSRKRLRKSDKVTLGRKVEIKLENRKRAVGRKVLSHKRYDDEASLAVNTLASLKGEELTDAIQRAGRLCRGEDSVKWYSLCKSKNDLDRSLHFLCAVHHGFAYQGNALRRHPELCKAFGTWVGKANQILQKPKLVAIKKIEEQRALKKKLAEARLSV